MSSAGYTYEIWDDGDLRQWGAFGIADITYQGPDLEQVAVEILTERLPPPPYSPAAGEFRLWTEATGLRQTTEPAYVGDVVTLRAGS